MVTPTKNHLQSGAPVVEMLGIVKCYGPVAANDGVDFILRKGEIHALLGENGAGKSTLMNVLVGMTHPNEGEIRVRGQKVTIESPRTAEKLGIGMVHQHFMLIPSLTVTENIVLGLKTSRSPWLALDDACKRVAELSEQYHIQVDPHALVGSLTAGEQQRVEILKQLYRNADILILDEPTAVLTPQEVEGLCRILRSMADSGYSIVLITHKLEEALNWCDQIDVLRDGRLVKSLPAGSVNREQLAAMMVGREVIFQYPRTEMQCGEVVLEGRGICARGAGKRMLLQDVSLDVRCGEVVGIAGVAGNGQSELARVLAGLNSLDAGQVFLSGEDITGATIEERIRKGLSYIPDDRHRLGMLPEMSVEENLVLKQTREPSFSRPWKLNLEAIRQYATSLVQKYRIRTPEVSAQMKALSGGNQQKVVLAREIELLPHVIVADQPTRGLDVGAIETIHRLLLDARAKGLGVLLISTELEEILSLSDRILVMFAGRIVYETTAKEADLKKIGLAMAGEVVT